MNNLSQPAVLTLLGIALIVVIDTIGAILSRKLKFHYALLSIASIVIYILIASFIATKSNLLQTMAAVIAMGIFDATIGWELTKKLGANFGDLKDEIEKISVHGRVTANIIFSIVAGFIGYWIS